MFVLHFAEYYSNAQSALKYTEWFDTKEEALHYAEYYKDIDSIKISIEDYSTHEITIVK